VPPPFDCESTLFAPDDRASYRRCTLCVSSPQTVTRYSRAPGWSLFTHIRICATRPDTASER
ncbi:MAG: hypothetical protein K2G78_06270, partial [Muribaculaceae bacterium]|nr:hypothetical protein [Muribaculaceae bacterium]